MEVFRRIRKIIRPFFYGCTIGVLLMYGLVVADRIGLINGLVDVVYAATGTIRPDGVGNFTNGTPTTCGTANNFDCLNEVITSPTAPVTTGDYLLQTSAQTDSFTVDNSLTDVATATRVRVYVYHKEGGTNMTLNVSLWNAAETVQIATTSSYTRTTAGWDVVDKGGLSLTQSDITGLRVRLNCTKGGGKGTDCISYAAYAVVDYSQLVHVTVSALGTHRNRIDIGTTTAYVGGTFVMKENTGSSRDISSIKLTEVGTVDTANLNNVRLYYENAANCSTATYNGTESAYDIPRSFTGNTVTFSATGIGVTPTLQLCVYVVLGVSTTATYGQTLQLQIANPSTDVVGSGGATVEPATAVAPTSFSTLERAAAVQTRYHWRKDNGDEGDTASGADSYTSGSENTKINSATKNSHYRLRLQVDNEGNATTSATQYRLEYGTKVTTCANITAGNWVDVHASIDDWDMVNSNNVSVNDGNTTNITSSAKGAITDPGASTFVGTGALRETTSLSGSITLTPVQFTELEYSLLASSGIVDGTTYCFRVTKNGTPLYSYTNYPEITFNADVTVSAEEAQPSTISIPTANNYLGGFVFSSTTTGTQDIDKITISASSTVGDITTAFSNIKLYYETDTSNPYICDGMTYDGGETQYGGVSGQTNASFSAAGTSTFTGGVATTPTVSTSQAVCLYVVLDVTASSSNGDNLDILISDPSTEVVLSTGTVAPASTVGLSGMTTLISPYVNQIHYHWRQNNGTEVTASSSVANEDTVFTDLPVNTVQRLRFGVANTGGETTGNYQYRLEWGQKVTSCGAVSTWYDIDTVSDEWSIAASQLVDNSDTTDISNSYGGVTNVGTFLNTNGGQQDVDGITGNINLPSNGWLELEYSIVADLNTPEGASYCFRVTNNGTPLDYYTTYPEATIKLGTDFAVYRGSFSMTGTSTTLNEGFDYDLQFNSSTRAFIRLTNTHLTGSGPAAGTAANANSDDTTVFIENPNNIENSVTIRRTTSAPAGDTRVTWEVIEYIGDIGGENEIYVHGAGVINVTGAGVAGTSSAVSGGVTNDSQVVPFITAQYNADTGRLNYNYGLFTSFWNSGADTVTVTRGEGGSDASVSYAVVEFRGANWNVWRVEENYQVTPGNTDTESFGPLQTGDITKAFVHAQHRVANGQDDHASFGHEVWLSSFSAVSFRLNGILPAGDEADHVSVAWVIENKQTSGDVMFVQQKAGSIPDGGGGLTVSNITLDYQIADISDVSLFVNNSNNNTGRSYPESMISAEIISDTQVQLQVSDDTGANLYRIEVVEWPTAAAKLIQNDFWLYEDNDNLTPATPWGGLSENEEMTANDTPIASGQNIRIRMNLAVTAAALPAGADAFKLQYGKRVTTCDSVTSNSSWLNLGALSSTTAKWRGYDATPVDGTQLTTSFILTESTIAGTYEETNNTALVPSLAVVGDSVEYDWNIQDNGADDKSDYCFRMVYADGQVFESYSTYPVIRTVGYGPEIGDWKWFDDETNVTPSISLAATNTAPIDIAFNNPIKLRAIITEKSGASGDPAKFKLQYSQYADFSAVYDVVATSTCTASSTWCYFNGAGIDNATVTSNTLSGITGTCVGGSGGGCGTHNEGSSSSSATFVQPAYSSQEFEFTIVHAGARANAVYYFRLFNVVDNEIVLASSTLPSLVTQGAALTFTMEGINSGTIIDGVTIDVNSSTTSIPFGSVPLDTEYTAAYRMNVNTNATEGYQVLLISDQNLTNTYGATIDPVTGSNASPLPWTTACSASALSCFGYHVEDDLLEGGSARFALNDSYAALSTSSAEEVMYSSVPTEDVHDIVFKIQVRGTQPAGDYQANIMLISIPIF